MPISRVAPANRSEEGFTLVELLVVLVLLATIAVFVLPRFEILIPAPQAARRQELARELELLRLRAIFENRPIAVDPMALVGEGEGMHWSPAAGNESLLLFAPDGRSSGGSLLFADGGRILVDPQRGLRIDE